MAEYIEKSELVERIKELTEKSDYFTRTMKEDLYFAIAETPTKHISEISEIKDIIHNEIARQQTEQFRVLGLDKVRVDIGIMHQYTALVLDEIETLIETKI